MLTHPPQLAVGDGSSRSSRKDGKHWFRVIIIVVDGILGLNLSFYLRLHTTAVIIEHNFALRLLLLTFAPFYDYQQHNQNNLHEECDHYHSYNDINKYAPSRIQPELS